MKKIREKKLIKNPIVWWMMIVFLVMSSIISGIAGYFAYHQKRGELLAELDMQLLQVAYEYQNITDEFWAVYLPIFENPDNTGFLTGYFANGEAGDLSPMEKLRLSGVLSHMAAREERVQWIAVYSPQREKNYIYFLESSTLQLLPENFPYLGELTNNKRKMEIYAEQIVQIGDYRYHNIAVAGGAPGKIKDGRIIVGYDINRLGGLCEKSEDFESLRFDIFWDDKVIFSSGEKKNWPFSECEPGKGNIYRFDGEKWYVQVLGESLKGARICYAVKWSELFWDAGKSITGILSVTMFMAILAVSVYFLTLGNLTKEVNVIRNGLDVIGQNKLSYRIDESFNQPELAAIAAAVNQMSQSLQENIARIHEYEQRQIKSELQELQAKFNPHFIYNTLEIFRARCYQNGDDETAELIAQTAAIFRGVIGSKSFIPMQEELAFGKRYLALFRARYGDKVRISYDIDTEVLQYGIIRNVFQPLIENYFEHGYNPANNENYILFRGCIRDEETILLSVEDNGFGMEEAALQKLNDSLRKPIISEKESYGLRNLHQRLRLFYGGECGLKLCAGKGQGLIIQMIIKRQKCE